MKILILGASGMLGHKLFLQLSQYEDLDVHATVRNREPLRRYLSANMSKKLHTNVDVNNFDSIIRVITATNPEMVINCIGIVKQGALGQDPLTCISINALLPHKIAWVCQLAGARLLHISTDCVFSGRQGDYRENDLPDAADMYGRSKLLGELDYPHTLTLRTSIIGHELDSRLGLVEWFLSQRFTVQGYCQHIYTGFPTTELAGIIVRYVIPNTKLHGIYHLSSQPISKFDLLNLIAREYKLKITVEPCYDTACDRSLNSDQLRSLIGYVPPSWSEMINRMYQDYLATPYLREISSMC